MEMLPRQPVQGPAPRPRGLLGASCTESRHWRGCPAPAGAWGPGPALPGCSGVATDGEEGEARGRVVGAGPQEEDARKKEKVDSGGRGATCCPLKGAGCARPYGDLTVAFGEPKEGSIFQQEEQAGRAWGSQGSRSCDQDAASRPTRLASSTWFNWIRWGPAHPSSVPSGGLQASTGTYPVPGARGAHSGTSQGSQPRGPCSPVPLFPAVALPLRSLAALHSGGFLRKDPAQPVRKD